jgi:hypothetical protein
MANQERAKTAFDERSLFEAIAVLRDRAAQCSKLHSIISLAVASIASKQESFDQRPAEGTRRTQTQLHLRLRLSRRLPSIKSSINALGTSLCSGGRGERVSNRWRALSRPRYPRAGVSICPAANTERTPRGGGVSCSIGASDPRARARRRRSEEPLRLHCGDDAATADIMMCLAP